MLDYKTRPMPSALGGVTGTVKQQLGDVMGSGNFYVSPEMSRELRRIDHGVDHIKLDHDFLGSSREWAQQWPQADSERQGAAQAMNHTARTVHGLKGPMEARTINSQQDNEVRQQHHTAMGAIRGAQQALGPHVETSIDRVKQYCDHIGVTNRYTGYKNNLNRGTRDPVRLGYRWLDDDRRNAGFRTARSAVPAGSVMRQSDPRLALSARSPLKRMEPLTCNSMEKPVQACSKSVQEQCGINTVFPGSTEYMVRYRRPPTDTPTVPFTVNPIPNTGAHGRPQARNVWEPSVTEYQWRYEWPDSKKIDKLPWIKKW